MRIKEILSQHRRDFAAMLVCEHCNHEQKLTGGYDDSFYHQNVIPSIECKSCGKIAPENYRPLATKYHDSQIV